MRLPDIYIVNSLLANWLYNSIFSLSGAGVKLGAVVINSDIGVGEGVNLDFP